MQHEIRPYERDRDLTTVDRIWREVGWLDSDDEVETLDWFLAGSTAEVGLLDGEAECAVLWVPGSIRYQSDAEATDLPFCAITAVTTSRIGRKQGFASTMTARALATAADAGAAVAGLGIFDQGFYDRLGFGSSAYDHIFRIDPTDLALDHIPYRQPVRLGPDDHAEIHAAMHARHRGHGGVVLDPPETTRAEMVWASNHFGLGYRADDGRLTHFVFGTATGEHGPYKIRIMGYEEPHQVLELLRLMKELGDQVTTVRLMEPPEIQLQDLLRTPFRRATQTERSTHANGIESYPWLQLRMLDVAACVAARTWSGPTIGFNLALTDPAVAYLDDWSGQWPGVGGDHVVSIGQTSGAERGTDPALPTLSASVNAFTRLWFGVRPATSLSLTDDLSGPPPLLAALDQALRLPPPHAGWDF